MALHISTRLSANKEFQWQDPVDDLFESFINPDSFHLANTDVEREYSDDLISFLDTQASTSRSDSIDSAPMPDLDSSHIKLEPEDSWHAALSSFVQGETHVASSSTSDNTVLEQPARCSIYSRACGRSAVSESDLFKLQRRDTPIPSLDITLSSTPTSPGWSSKSKSRAFFSTPLVVRKKPRAPPSSIEKPARRGSLSPKMMSPANCRLSSHQTTLDRNFHAAVRAEQVTFKTPFINGRPTSPPASAQMKQEAFAWQFDNHQAVGRPYGFQEDIEQPKSSLSNGYFFQHPNTPVASPTFENRPAHPPTSFAEPQPSTQLSLYPSTPYNMHPEHSEYLMTPPSTQPMSNGQWTDGHASSPNMLQMDKAERWWDPSSAQSNPASDVTCGARAASNMLGLGISGIHNADLAAVANNGGGEIMQPAARAPQKVASSPTPRSVHNRSIQFSASASSSPAVAQSVYPLSPLQDHAQARQSQGMRQPTMYRHHQRHHTVGGPITISPAMISQPSQFEEHTPSASPSPSGRAATHRRTKSSTHTWRKSTSQTHGNSSRHTSVGFVNFTPDDSRKILTGVAPSGSSKTKARREREAADKRRKLSEAAKKAVLEAGGDLGTLEREGLLVLGSEL